MPSYRLNLTIDEEFAEILQSLKSASPLSTDVSLIRDAVGAKYIAQRKAERKAWSDNLPEIKLNPQQIQELEKNIEESLSSGFTKRYTSAKNLMQDLIN
jgi:6-phosphogluconate dehydrogenase